MFSNRDKFNEVRRELAIRLRIYPRWVEEGRMKLDHADRLIAVMKEIGEDYARLAEAEELQERLL